MRTRAILLMTLATTWMFGSGQPDTITIDKANINLTLKMGKLFIPIDGVELDSIRITSKEGRLDTTILKYFDEKNDTVTFADFKDFRGVVIFDNKGNEIDIEDPEGKKKEKTKCLGFEFGLNNYMTADNSFELSDENEFMELRAGRSRKVGLSFPVMDGWIAREKLGLILGLGIELHNYHFSGNTTLIDNDDTLVHYFSSAGLDKNKLLVSHLTMPLMIEFQPCESFHIAVGGIGKLRLTAHTKQVIGRNKSKESEDYNLAQLACDATVRFGFKHIGFYANYSLLSMFREGEGPELYPVEAGIRIY